MALFRYLCPADSTLDLQGPISQAVLRAVIEEVNREVKKAETQTKKMGTVPLFCRGREGSISQVCKHQWSLCCC